MTPIVTRILLFCLIPAGIYLLVQGIKWIRKFLGGAVLLDIPLMQTEAQFSVSKEGSFDIWQKGKTLRKTAVNMPVPVIYNQQTRGTVRLEYPVAVVNSNDGSLGRIRLLTFYATAGIYHYQLSADTFERDAWLEKLRTSKKSDVTNYGIEIKESRPTWWLVFGILVLILAAFCIICGLVFTLNSNAIL